MDWFDLLAVQGTLRNLLHHHSLKASILGCSAFFMIQLSQPYMTTGKTIALAIWTFVGRGMSLLFNTLSAAKSLQSCPTLCGPIDGSPPGFRPWDSPGKNTGVGCHFLLQCMKVKSESEVTQSWPTLSDLMDCSLPSSSVHGIFQARVLEWGAIAYTLSKFVITFLPISKMSSDFMDAVTIHSDFTDKKWNLSLFPPFHPLFATNYGTPLQYSCLENPMDGGAWWATVHGVAKSRTRLSDFTFTFHFQALEKEMATHSSVLAWRIPGMGEPYGLLSMGSHRVGHD